LSKGILPLIPACLAVDEVLSSPRPDHDPHPLVSTRLRARILAPPIPAAPSIDRFCFGRAADIWSISRAAAPPTTRTYQPALWAPRGPWYYTRPSSAA